MKSDANGFSDPTKTIRAELATAHSEFHALLDALAVEDLHKISLNPGWTTGENPAHNLWPYHPEYPAANDAPVRRLSQGSSKPFAWLLNISTGAFNRINALGACLQGRVFTYLRLGKLYDSTYFSLLKQVDSLKDDEWERGMYYPTKWDANFSEFTTLEKLFRYPIIHFNFHLNQIAR